MILSSLFFLNMNNTIRIILPALLSSFLLSGCFNFGERTTVTNGNTKDNYRTFETTEFAMEVPSDWQVIGRDKFTSEIPSETVVVFRNNIKNDTFTANVNVVRRVLQENETSLDFAKRTINRESGDLASYREYKKETKKISIGDNSEDTYISYFEARKSTQDLLIQYIQVYGVRGKAAFIVTGAFSPNEEQSTVQTVENIVKSFRLK
jgi:hypothetical protein